MARALWLPGVLRAAGLVVHEQPGWQTRGDDNFEPIGIICHATAGSSNSTDAAEISVILNGSETAPPPIAQMYLSRSGEIWVIASGRCNHVRVGWAGRFEGVGNNRLFGIEAQNDNKGQNWPSVQYEAYATACAAIVDYKGWSTNEVGGHKEHQPYPPPAGQTSTKTDPTFNMPNFRTRVQYYLDGGDMATAFELMQKMIHDQWAPTKSEWVAAGGSASWYDMLAAVGSPGPSKFVQDFKALVTKVNGLDNKLNEVNGKCDQIIAALAAGGGDPDTSAILSAISQVDEKVVEVNNLCGQIYAAVGINLSDAERDALGMNTPPPPTP